MKLRLTDYNDNTYMDTDGSCEVCMYTGLLDHPEFKELDEAQLRGLEADETDPWHTALDAILWCASDQSTEEDLNEALSWALVDKTA